MKQYRYGISNFLDEAISWAIWTALYCSDAQRLRGVDASARRGGGAGSAVSAPLTESPSLTSSGSTGYCGCSGGRRGG